MEMVGVPMEMVEEILTRLPVKSVLRFKCVSRNWSSLIQSKRFIEAHYCCKSNQDRLVFHTINIDHMLRRRDRYEDVNGDVLHLPSRSEVQVTHYLGPRAGLFCQANIYGDIVLLNPATRKVKRVPRLCFEHKFLRWHYFKLGFGLDPSGGDYKLVAFDVNVYSKSPFVFIYNTSDDCWKRIEDFGSGSSSLMMKANSATGSEMFLNGVYYWVVYRFRFDPTAILAFDMTTEKFREIKGPKGVGYGLKDAIIGVYGKSIGLMLWCRREFWVMGEEGCWSKIFCLKPHLGPICMLKNEIVAKDESNLVLVDVFTQDVRKVKAPQPLEQIYSLFAYKESLASIKGEEVLS